MTTPCTRTLFNFQPLGKRAVEAEFNGGYVTSDGGVLLLREIDAKIRLIRRFANCFIDYRRPERIEHTVEELLAQRVYALAMGHEDLNDHEDLRVDPLLAVAAGKEDPTGESRSRKRDQGKGLAGKSTLNRLELTPADASEASRYKKIVYDERKIADFFVHQFVDSFEVPPREITLDLDATDDPIHGGQEGRFFQGYYGNYCYLPLYIFCGRRLLAAKLRTSKRDASHGAKEELERIIGIIRSRWPRVRITIRADSGFTREEIMAWCEANDVRYMLGLAKNDRLVEMLAPQMEAARKAYEATGQASRVFADFTYQTLDSWSRARRVVGKAEHLKDGANPRFVVTNIPAEERDSREIYEDDYCARGDMENRIKEQQLELFADRTSTHFMRSNQLRLWFSSVAYELMEALRRLALAGTEMAKAQCGTIREKLLKIGGRVKVSARRVYVMLSSAFTYQEVFHKAYRALGEVASIVLVT